ncbi:MAG TPA: phosphoenolpyruvate--protein phosphotransferase [Chitinophagaceae bacterium]|nr:phosphoenolpyruvate--protein phosphotransferase [Chitinophagaceae bacterium]
MKGIGASPGIAIGKALVINKQVIKTTGIALQNEEEVIIELEKFHHAVTSAVGEVNLLIQELSLQGDKNTAAIMEVLVELLQDEQIAVDIIEKIKTEYKTANDAVIEVIDNAAEMFRNMKDEYFSARAADVQDTGSRLIKHLNGSSSLMESIPAGSIMIAEDLTPSDTIALDITKIIGFVTQAGGKTSHTAIIAKSKGIPAIVGYGAGIAGIQTNDILIIDGSDGTIIVNPTEEEIIDYKARQASFIKHLTMLQSLKNVSAKTPDDVRITLLANISNAQDMEEAFDFGAEGSGLLRTEFLFMARNSPPGEEEQFEFYKSIALKAKGKPVTVRTLDIGGDKPLPYFNLPSEQNPFLGYRAIRICLDRKDIFFTQLSAILRASAFGGLRIMFPMISNISELREAKSVLNDVKSHLHVHNIPFNQHIEIGIMVEIPSAAITADILAKEVDFFSIGTNDLCQYALAVDRMNEQVKHLYDPFNPGVLRLIQNVIEQGNKHNVHVGMCGELAGDPLATLLLIGMGLREFSMSAASIPYIKNIIVNNSFTSAREIYKTVMEMDSSENITSYLKEIAK